MKTQSIFVAFASLACKTFAFQPVSTTVPSFRQVTHTSNNQYGLMSSMTRLYHPISPATTTLGQSVQNDEKIENESDFIFNGQSTLSLVAAQSLLVVGAIVAAKILNVPNLGLGGGFTLDGTSVESGLLATVPLFILAFVLDFVEKEVPALNDVSKATQRSVLALLGGARKPALALGVSVALGAAAGLGEEMLFRGVLQSELTDRFGDIAALITSSIIFGALHAVTPLYAILASLASLYFGELYLQYHNLAVPIICHGVYDVGALFAAHIQVSGMTLDERVELQNWVPPGGSPGGRDNF